MEKLRGCLVGCFKKQFLVFKQHYMYFHTLFRLHVFPKNTIKLLEQRYQTASKLQEHGINYEGQNCSTCSHLRNYTMTIGGLLIPYNGDHIFCIPIWSLKQKRGKMQNWLSQFLQILFQSSNFTFVHFNPLTFKFI